MSEHEKQSFRFGKVAVERGYLTPTQLHQALGEQVEDDLENRPHRVLGAICFDHGWITPAQIEEVLNIMFKKRDNS